MNYKFLLSSAHSLSIVFLMYTATDRLLLTLKGHLSAITDLHYSKHGDRILTASQRDGVVRIWSWNSDPAAAKSSTSSSSSSNASIRNVSHILLKLTNSNASVSNGVRHGPPSRPNRSITSAIACDVAVWTCDDTKVITSQSELLKQNGNDIVVGSQYLFLWDSYSGHCLLGIPEAHSMPCPVVLPHPFLPSIICSAGADGVVRLWDWDSGKCIFLHTNIADFGPIETRERGTNFGYLDGEFSPDGTTLVLTDDSGRLTVLDSSNIGEGSRDMVEAKARSSPDWMKEQYFSNDYYDLFYDVNGYCVERGSERPPHLAPTGARCSHSGAPFSAGVNETLKCLRGPMPLCNNVARWHRQVVRECARKMTLRQVHLKGNLNRQYEATSTILVRHGSKSTSLLKPTAQGPPSGTPQASRSQNGALAGSSHRSSRHLSSNYRWSDDADIEMADDEPDHESDDEDFELTISNNGGSRARGPAVVDSESEDLELEDDQLNPSRSSSRHRLVVAEEEDESGDEFDEYVSMNNSPTGPFMADYDTHFFRMPSRELGNHVQRHWLHRNESSSSHGGRKLYTPQVGDVVVYIPQAHLGSLTEYPGVQTPPWQHWPDDATWPVVQCYVRNIRYRFPYKDYKTCNSVIAKLTLEATGIPELSTDRIFGWPSPTFTTLTKCHVFEVSLSIRQAEITSCTMVFLRRLLFNFIKVEPICR